MSHIAVLIPRYPKLSETFVADELRLLLERGLGLRVVTLRVKHEPVAGPDPAGLGHRLDALPSRAALRAELPRARLRLLVRRPVRFLRTWLWALSDARRFPERRCRRRFDEATWLVARGALASPEVAHVHAHFLKETADVALYASALLRCSFSLSAHARDIFTSADARIARLLGASVGAMTCTRFNREHLQALAPADGPRVELAYHGVDTERFTPALRPRPPRPGRDPLVAVGRLVSKKGYDVLLRALAALEPSGDPPRCEIAGDGPEREPLRALARELGLDERVRFLGAVPRDEVAGLLARAGAFVQPSRLLEDGDRDGIPNALAEAMACGTPVVATRVSGIPELVEDGRSGLLVEPEDPQGLARALAQLVSQSETAEALGRAARLRVVEVFDRAHWIGRCESLLRSWAGLAEAHPPGLAAPQVEEPELAGGVAQRER